MSARLDRLNGKRHESPAGGGLAEASRYAEYSTRFSSGGAVRLSPRPRREFGTVPFSGLGGSTHSDYTPVVASNLVFTKEGASRISASETV